MNTLANGVLIFLLLTNLAQMGSSRLRIVIQMLAIQGIALSLLPFLFARAGDTELDTIVLALIALLLRGILIPWLLLRALHKTGVNREVEPYIGFTTSTLIGVVALATCFHLSPRLAIPSAEAVSDACSCCPFQHFCRAVSDHYPSQGAKSGGGLSGH